jgi:hypothetical protein
MSTLSPEQLDDLQAFLKDWLRHTGRTQSDLRRALQASSIRMPILLEVLQATLASRGLAGLAEQLCGIEERWQAEEAQGGPSSLAGAPALDDSLGQLDLLLREIRGDRAD